MQLFLYQIDANFSVKSNLFCQLFSINLSPFFSLHMLPSPFVWEVIWQINNLCNYRVTYSVWRQLSVENIVIFSLEDGNNLHDAAARVYILERSCLCIMDVTICIKRWKDFATVSIGKSPVSPSILGTGSTLQRILIVWVFSCDQIIYFT